MPVYEKEPPGSGSSITESDPVASAALVSHISSDSGTIFTATSLVSRGGATGLTVTAARMSSFGQDAEYAYADSSQFGYDASAFVDACAFGSGATADGVGSVVIGKSSLTAGDYSIVIGPSSGGINAAADKIMLGRGVVGAGADSIAIGRGSSTNGADAIAIGKTASSVITGVAIGSAAVAGATNGIAVGLAASATGTSSLAVGNSAAAGALGSVALGFGASVGIGSNSICIGASAASGAGASATVIGEGATATGATGNMTVIGSSATAAGTNATAIGSAASASGTNTFALGTGASAGFARAVCLGPFAAAAAADDVVIGNSAAGSNPNGYIRGNQGTGTVHFSPQVAGNITLGVSRTAFYWGDTFVDRLVSRNPINDYLGRRGTTTNGATGVGTSRWTGMAPAVEVASPEATLVFSNTTGWAVRNTSGVTQLCAVWVNIDFTGIGAGAGGLLVDVNATESAAIASDAPRSSLSTAATAVHSFSCWVSVPHNSYIRVWWTTASSGVANALNVARFYVRQL